MHESTEMKSWLWTKKFVPAYVPKWAISREEYCARYSLDILVYCPAVKITNRCNWKQYSMQCGVTKASTVTLHSVRVSELVQTMRSASASGFRCFKIMSTGRKPWPWRNLATYFNILRYEILDIATKSAMNSGNDLEGPPPAFIFELHMHNISACESIILYRYLIFLKTLWSWISCNS